MDVTEDQSKVEEYKDIEELRPNMRGLNLKVRCASKNEEREGFSRKTGEDFRVIESLVGDETGSVLLTLWNEHIDQIEVGKAYLLSNVYTSIYRNSLRLNVGRYGNIEENDEGAPDEVNEENNLSDEYFEDIRRTRPRYSGYQPRTPGDSQPSWKRSWSNRKRRRPY